MTFPLRAALVGTALLTCLTASPARVLAQGSHGHSHAAPNGGQIQQIGPLEGELVVKGSEVTLYLVDEQEKKVDAAPFSATAVVLAKGNQQKSVQLTPAGDNKLAGRVDFPVEGKFRATVSLKRGPGDTGKARFSLDPK